MLSQEEGENGFELVDSPKEGAMEGSGPTPLPSWITPPSNLPISLIAVPPSLTLSSAPLLPPSTSTPITSNAPQLFTPTTVTHLASQVPNLPIVMPVSPIVEQNLPTHEVSTLEIAVLESPTMTEVKEEEEERGGGANNELSRGGGIFNWMKEALPGKAILAKVAEKARSSVDTMITTLDPQMKEFINSGGDIDIAVASEKELKVSAVREAFQTVFGKASVRGFESQRSSETTQPVGFSNGLTAAQERIKYLREKELVNHQQAVVSVEGFVVELFENNWFEINCLVLEDPVRNLSLQAFSQPLMIPLKVIQRIKDSGFSVTVGQAVAEELNLSPTEWQMELTGISRREVLLLAAKTLANAYK